MKDRGMKKGRPENAKRGGFLHKEENDVLCKEGTEELTGNRSCCPMREETEKK